MVRNNDAVGTGIRVGSNEDVDGVIIMGNRINLVLRATDRGSNIVVSGTGTEEGRQEITIRIKDALGVVLNEERQTIDDVEIERLIQMWISGTPV